MTKPCPACDLLILVAAPSRWGGTPIPFDPIPGTGGHHDTALSADLSHVAVHAAAAGNLKGKVPLYQAHMWTCPRKMRIPGDRAMTDLQGYSQAAAGWTGDPIPPAVDAEVLSQPWEGIKGTPRDCDDLLSLDDTALPRRRMMTAMTRTLYRAVNAVPAAPEARRIAERMRNPQTGDLVTEITSDGHRGFGVLLERRRERAGYPAMSAATNFPSREVRGNDLGSSGDIRYVQYGPDALDVARWDCAQFITVLVDDREGS